jgi:transcriptional regulator with XRE-family HTH domain
MPVSGPTVVRRQLGRRLRRLREESGKTEQQVEDAKLVSRTKLWRMESGKVSIKIPDVRTLCWFYGADDKLTDALATMALGTLEQGWWEEYGDVVPGWFRLYVGLEGAASQIEYYDGELVPGEFQTEDYARAIFRTAQPDNGDEDAIGRLVALRMERQETLLQRDPPPRLVVVLGAGSLARQVGGPAAMAAQIDRLRHLDTLDHIEIRVLPWDAGAHASMLGAFRIMDFADQEDPDVVYLETQVGSRYLEKASHLTTYRQTFSTIYHQAVPLKEYS